SITVVVLLILAAAAIAFAFSRRGGSKSPRSEQGDLSAHPIADPPNHVPPTPPNSGDGLGPDEQGRIRIPEVEALGGEWAKVWWYAPWVLQSHGSTFPAPVERQLRFACGCDENGDLGPCP